MKREWKPGDVAMLRCRDGVERLAILADRGTLSPLWIAEAVEWGRLSDDVPVRPLVVIDPEDREQVERLLDEFRSLSGWASSIKRESANAMQAALREYADPQPPKPEEPTGLGAVVEDVEGRKWVRHDNTPGSFPWVHAGHGVAGWSEIDAVRVLSEGVTEDGAQ